MQTIRTKIRLKTFLSIILVVVTILLFSGCYDLGSFKDTEQYYSTFGEVALINQEGADKVKTYSFKDYFYNEESVNDFAGNIVEQDEYIYLVLPVQKGFNLAEFSIFLKSEKGGAVYYSLYISDFIPANIRKYSDPKTKVKTDEKGDIIYDAEGNPLTEEIVYGDLSLDSSIYQGNISLAPNQWDSFTAKLVTKNSSTINKYFVADGEYIIIRFDSNSGLGFDKGYEKLSFSLINILIRAL